MESKGKIGKVSFLCCLACCLLVARSGNSRDGWMDDLPAAPVKLPWEPRGVLK